MEWVYNRPEVIYGALTNNGVTEMTVLAHSLNGCLRIRAAKNGKTAVVELRNKRHPEHWTYCVWRSQPVEKAWTLFTNQCRFHTEPASETIQPGL